MSGIAGGTDAAKVLARIGGALENVGAMSESMTRHHLWVIRGIMADIDPETDLSSAELLALLSVLAPVHTRVLARRAERVGAARNGTFPGTRPPALTILRNTPTNLS